MSPLQMSLYAGPCPLASLRDRYKATLADSIVQVAIGAPFIVGGLLSDSGLPTGVLLTVGMLLIPGLYDAALVGRRGQTVGKRAVAIRVVRLDGGSVGYGWAASRSFVKMLTLLPPVIVFQVASFMTSLNNQTLHDRVARTVVVKCR